MGSLVSTSPSTGAELRRWETHTPEQIEACVAAADVAARGWRQRPVAERARVLVGLAEHLEQRREYLARLITDEMGKPVTEALAEVDKCAVTCRFYAEHAPEQLAPRPVATPAARSWVGYEPLGVVLAVMLDHLRERRFLFPTHNS